MFSEPVLALLGNDALLRDPAIDTLLKIADNLLKHPNDPKYRSLSLTSSAIEKKLLPTAGAFELLFFMGFVEAGDKLMFTDETALIEVKKIRDELMAAKVKLSLEKHGENKALLPPTSNHNSEEDFRQMLTSEFERVMIYENASLKSKAYNEIPVKELNDSARVKLDVINNNLPKDAIPMDLQDCLLIELLSWFKEKFFKWFNIPSCPMCAVQMVGVQSPQPTQDELMFGASRVEEYRCMNCQISRRFPRYNHPGKLLQTRVGRCGEWANCFTLMCRAMGMDARYIHDVTDHVWTEVYSKSQCRWLHADPCENKLDTPLLYEQGWGKKLSYVIGYSKDEIVDVTWRYIKNYKETCRRRTRCREDWLSSVINDLNKAKQSHFQNDKVKFLERRLIMEFAEFFRSPRALKEGEAEGRNSGSLEWRLSRKETKTVEMSGKTITLSPEEVEKKEFILQYSSSQDQYCRKITGSKESGWKSSIFSCKNINLKVENDWKMTYLARTEGSDTAEICWKIDWKGTKLKFDSARILFQCSTFHGGEVHWQVCVGDVCLQGKPDGVLTIDKSLGENSDHLEVLAELTSGQGKDAWQHTQLFRMSTEEATLYPFQIQIKFSE